MSRTPKTLDPAAWPQPGADFAALRAQAIALVEAMSGTVWTDYNYSDPGVTIIEQLCYALTELPYRADLPMVEILSPPDRPSLPLRRQGLLPVRAIMPCNPVTANDLRRLVIDRVPEVANVWFTPRTGGEPQGVSGLYEVTILTREDHRDDGGGDDDDDRGDRNDQEQHRLVHEVMQCYTAHRALCEDALRPTILRGIDVRVHAVVILVEGADPSDTLARILYSLGLFLAPEPRRTSLDEMLDGGARTADIFVGPLMVRGFILDDQLTPFPSTVTIAQFRKVVAQTPGVSAVDQLSVTVGSDDGRGGHTIHSGGIDVPPGAVFRVQPASRHGHPTIRMIRDKAICHPNEARTRRRLAELWKRHRRTYPLSESYPQHYGTPASRYRPLSSYTSVQNQFPAIYGIGRNALHYRASTLREAQANQLKGYLMAFDQLLADYFAQLAFVRNLLSVEAGGHTTYAVQSLRSIVPGSESLLGPGYEEGLAEVSAETDPADARRNAVLDLLLSFYAEQIDLSKHRAGNSTEEAESADSQIRAKQAMLRNVDFMTRNRGKGLDYLRPASVRSVSGVERTSRLQLNLLDPAAEDGGHGRPDDPVEVRHPAEASFGKLLPPEVVLGVRHLFTPVGDGDRDGAGTASWQGPSPLAGHRVAASLLAALPDRSSYRFIRMEESGSLVVVCVDVDGRWWLIGEYHSTADALSVLWTLIRAAGDHHWRRRHRSDLYIVEWILLRHAWKGGEDDGRRYSFRVTAVLAMDPREGNGENWRSESRDVLRENTPAHIALDCLYLDHRQMDIFRHLYQEWMEALRCGSRTKRNKASRHLERFLAGHGAGQEAAALNHGDAKPAPSEPASAQPEPGRAEEERAEEERAEEGPGTEPPAFRSLLDRSGVPSAGGDMAGGEPQPDPAPSDPAPAPATPPSPSVPPLPAPPLSGTGGDPAPPAETSESKPRGSWLSRLLSRLKKPKAAKGTTDAEGTDTPEGGAGNAAQPDAADTASGSRQRFGKGGTRPSRPSKPPPAPSPPPSPPASPQAQPAPPGAKGFDTDTVLTASSAAAFAKEFSFAIRYLSRSGTEASGDLGPQEVADILGAGLALMAVQHVSPAGWTPSETLGQQYGAAAAANADAAGLARGICLWLDLEGVDGDASSDAVIQYCNAWFQAVSAGGYLPGLYVGANCGLSSQQLGSSLACDYFWESGSNVPDVEPTGYCLLQTISGAYEIDGVTYDYDVVQADNEGKTPIWMAATEGTG